MKKLTILASLLFSAAMISCGSDKEKTETSGAQTETSANDETEESSGNTTAEAFFKDKSALKKAEQQLKDLPKFKGKDIKVFQLIHFYDGKIKISIQDPEKPENIDDYTYRNGKWEEPQPVQISGDGSMEDNVFPLSTMKFETVADIYKQLETKAKEVEGAKIDTHYYYQLSVHDQSTKWRASITGTRETLTGTFNPDGTLIEFVKN